MKFKNKYFLFLILLIPLFLYSCGDDNEEPETVEINFISPSVGLVLPSGTWFDIEVEVTSPTPLKSFTLEVSNFRGLYRLLQRDDFQGNSGVISGSRFTLNTTTSTSLTVRVTVENMKGEIFIKDAGVGFVKK